MIYSSPEHARGELFGYCDVRHTLMSETSKMSIRHLLLVYTLESSYDPIFMKLCQNVNIHKI